MLRACIKYSNNAVYLPVSVVCRYVQGLSTNARQLCKNEYIELCVTYSGKLYLCFKDDFI